MHHTCHMKLFEQGKVALFNKAQTPIIAVSFHTRPLQQKSLDEKLSFGGCQSSPPRVLELLVLTLLSAWLYCVASTNFKILCG